MRGSTRPGDTSSQAHGGVDSRDAGSLRPDSETCAMSRRVDPLLDLTIHPLAGALGAEIAGVDLASDLPDDLVRKLEDALVEHQPRTVPACPRVLVQPARCA